MKIDLSFKQINYIIWALEYIEWENGSEDTELLRKIIQEQVNAQIGKIKHPLESFEDRVVLCVDNGVLDSKSSMSPSVSLEELAHDLWKRQEEVKNLFYKTFFISQAVSEKDLTDIMRHCHLEQRQTAHGGWTFKVVLD
jgi:hypothetical protein